MSLWFTTASVCVWVWRGRTFHWTPHTCLLSIIISSFHSLMVNTCSLVHCSFVQEATGYWWWFNDITSDDRRSKDPVLLCFMSSRQLGRPHCCYIIRTGRLPNIDYLSPSWWWWKVLTCLSFLAWNNITIIILAKWGSCERCILLNYQEF